MMYLILIETDPSLLPKDLSEKKKIMASNSETGRGTIRYLEIQHRQYYCQKSQI